MEKTYDELNENSEKSICMTVWLSHFISVLYDRLSLTLIWGDEQFRNTLIVQYILTSCNTIVNSAKAEKSLRLCLL